MRTELKGLFTHDELAPYTRLNNWINVLTLLFLWSIPLSLIYFYPQWKSPWLIIIGVLVMGAVQHTLATFVHEAAHFSLFTNKKLNDFFGHALCAAPLLSYMKDYRYFHFEHHRHTGKFDKDPELKFYRAMGVPPGFKSSQDVRQVFFNDFNGKNYLKGLNYLLTFLKEKRGKGVIQKPTLAENFCVIIWITLIPIFMWYTGRLTPYLLFWILPAMTITPICLRWHGFGEHIREKDGEASENTLTHKLDPLTTLFLYPINSSYHLEHHLWPNIPWYHLRAFHKWAMKNETFKTASEKLTVDGYFFGKKTVVEIAFPHQEN